ncbi:hypothetical protein NC651_019200 [Populus alba x Populus x berolinensis]|nr:hypothetical protein NC651_019200 [Populus alba x Populus x berolinensis]
MNSVQFKAFEEWSKHRLSTPSIDEVNSSFAVSSTSSGRPRADRPKNRVIFLTMMPPINSVSFSQTHAYGTGFNQPVFLAPFTEHIQATPHACNPNTKGLSTLQKS